MTGWTVRSVLQPVLLCLLMSARNARALSSSSATKVIDSHLHVWAATSESETFPYAAGSPPDPALQNVASTQELLNHMDAAGVAGALIVQPIHHQYDHSYVLKTALQGHPDRFKGMLLHNPALNTEQAVAQLEDLALQGFCGVRYNPYLWEKTSDNPPSWKPMSQGAGLAVYQRCAELRMPVGIMCFQGLDLHFDDIQALIQASPETRLILDHFGFTSVANKPENFDKLLSLAQYPNVYVKISALFRLGDEHPFERVRTERFEPLLKAFGAERLLYGSDFPFVLEQPGDYQSMVELVRSWMSSESDEAAIMGGTAEKLFGPWGSVVTTPQAEASSSSS